MKPRKMVNKVNNMRKTGLILLLSVLTLSLASCRINWFTETIDVPWYYVVIPVTLIFVCGYLILMSKIYVCPQCQTEFRAKPYHLFVTIHFGGKRIAKCPHCHRKGFCRIKK